MLLRPASPVVSADFGRRGASANMPGTVTKASAARAIQRAALDRSNSSENNSGATTVARAKEYWKTAM